MQVPKIASVLETCLYVDDLALSERFYAETLGLARVSRQEGRHVFFRVGPGMLLLFDPRESAAPDSKLPQHGTRGAGHVAFAVDEVELARWQTHLEEAGVTIEQVVQWPTGASSLYFRDPAGNSLELTSPRIWGFPVDAAGSGRPSAG